MTVQIRNLDWRIATLYAGCAYELLALSTELPTITDMIKRVGRFPVVGKFAVWAWCGFIAWHFLEDQP